MTSLTDEEVNKILKDAILKLRRVIDDVFHDLPDEGHEGINIIYTLAINICSDILCTIMETTSESFHEIEEKLCRDLENSIKIRINLLDSPELKNH